MGRRKISIKQITDPKLRHITFNKRKNGLIKKAAELSMLCNVNMLLVFEDGAGNLVQFSKNKLSSINNFFQECKYHNVLELTAKEYPHFFKVNHYKKTKNKNSENLEDANGELEINNGSTFGFNQSEAKETKIQTNDMKKKEVTSKKEDQQNTSFNPFLPQQAKTELLNGLENLRSNLLNDNRPFQDISGFTKKQTHKQKIPISISQTDANGKKLATTEVATKNLSLNPEMNEALFNSTNPYRKENFQEEQAKSLDNKAMEYPPATFIPPNIDPIKRLSGVPDSMNSPFQFYQANNRLRPFNNFGLPFTNEDAINSMLKTYNPFPFQLPGNVPFMGKPSANGEMDDKLLDTAKMLNYIHQAGNAPLNRQNIFPFSQAEYSKINQGQGAATNGADFHPTYLEENHEELPPIFKGDHRFETLPSGNLNHRRYGNFDNGYFGLEDEYGYEKAKKFKSN